MKRITTITFAILSFLFGRNTFAQEYPNSLTIENKGLSLTEIRNWLYAFGEISELQSNFTLEELVQKSHLSNKEKPYSIYQFNNYGINTEGIATIINFASDCEDTVTKVIYFDNKSGLFYHEKNYNTLANYNFVRILKTQYFGEIKNGKFERIGECKVKDSTSTKAGVLDEVEVDISPNPFKSSFNVILANAKNFKKMYVIEPDGKIIHEINYSKLLYENNQVEIDASSWASGIYFLRVLGDFGFKYKKIIRY